MIEIGCLRACGRDHPQSRRASDQGFPYLDVTPYGVDSIESAATLHQDIDTSAEQKIVGAVGPEKPMPTFTTADLADRQGPPYRQAEAAQILGVKIATLGAWRARGFGPRFLRLGRKHSRVRYPRADLWLGSTVAQFSPPTMRIRSSDGAAETRPQRAIRPPDDGA